MICDKHKVILIHIPKTGGTSVDISLTGKDTWFSDPYNKHLTAQEARKYYGEKKWKEYYKIGIVRNPYDKEVSLFKWAVIQKQVKPEMKFREYIAFYEKNEHFNPDHWRRNQMDWLQIDGKIAVDKVMRFEDLENDYKELCEKLGIKNSALQHRNRSRHETDTWQRYYNDDNVREIVKRRYSKDFAYFYQQLH